jgi:hypothetical protein
MTDGRHELPRTRRGGDAKRQLLNFQQDDHPYEKDLKNGKGGPPRGDSQRVTVKASGRPDMSNVRSP